MPYGEAQRRATERWIERIGRGRYLEIRREAKRRQRERDEKRLRAMGAVARAIREGMVKSLACEKCDREGVIYAHHHLGYEEEHWLDIQWLCRDCHVKAHRMMRRREVTAEQSREAMLAAHPRMLTSAEGGE